MSYQSFLTPAPLLQPGQVLADTYRIERFVGKGGMGEVYEASHARLSGRYAVKLLLRDLGSMDEVLHRFKQEAEVTSRLRHPNIVQVIDFDRLEDGKPYLVMEFLDGHDLAEELRRVRTLTPLRAADLIGQVAAGLAAAHDEGIIHRDLKPANIFLSPLRGSQREIAKIVDFGISKIRAVSTGVTRTQAVIGTPEYMAPEQARGQTKEVDARTDQFSLGAIAYEMLAGQPPFFGENVPAILYQVVHEPAPSLIDIGATTHAELDQVIRRAMSKYPADRFASVVEFAAAFTEAAQVAAGRAAATPGSMIPPASLTPRPSKSRSPSTTFRGTNGELAGTVQTLATRNRRRTLLAVGAGLALALVGGGVLALRDGGKNARTKKEAPPVAVAPKPTTPNPTPGVTATPTLAPEVEVQVVGGPEGLTVTVDGRQAKLPLRLPRADREHRLMFSAPGHESAELSVRATANLVIPLSLDPVRPVPRPRPPRAAKAKPVAKPESAPVRPSDHAVTDL